MSVINNIGKELLYKGLPKKKYLKVIYRYYHNKNLDLNSPKNFSEKLFWLKLYNQEYCSDLIQKCYDKYTVRKYITDRVGEEFLPKLYGVYDNAEEIDFDSFPDKYVLKVTQSCGYNIINNGNYSIDRNTIKLDGGIGEIVVKFKK